MNRASTDRVLYKCGCGAEFPGTGGLANHVKRTTNPDCSPERRFWMKVEKGDGCWTWKGAVTSKHGYGCVQWYGRVLGAHKVAWMLTNGDPGELCVLHRCDNRVCVNPAHLFTGTKADNSADKSSKLRDPSAALKPEQVREVRRLLAEGKMQKEIAGIIGVSNGVIHSISKGKTYRWLV